MNARDGLIEAGARKIAELTGMFDQREAAAAALAGFEAHAGGCWLVPLVATREMAEAMTDAEENGADAIELYPIMLAASPYAPENGA